MQGGSFVAPLAVLYGGAFMAGFNENLVNMALMAVMGEFGVDSVTAQWLVTGYMIVATVVVTCMAFLYRRFKLRTLFFCAAGLSLAGSAMGLLSFNFAFLLAARLVQAVGTGIFIPLMMNTILAVVPKNKMGAYLSIGSCMITFGPALAPVACGALVTGLGWRSIFAVPVAAMAVLAVAGAFLIRNVPTSEAHLDTPSVALSAVALFGLSFGLAELSALPVAAGAALALAAVAVAAFIVRQLRCAHPLIELSPCRSLLFWPTLILAMVAMMTTFSLSVLLPLYFEGALGLTAFASGVIILVPVLANAATSLFSGRVMDRFGAWPLLPAGFAVILVGLAVLAATSASLSLPLAFAGALLAYAGVGMVFSPSQTAGFRTLPPAQNPFGVALSTTFVQVAACIGPSLYIGIMSAVQQGAAAGGADAAAGAAQGFAVAIGVAAAVAAVGFGVASAYTVAARRWERAQRGGAAARAEAAAGAAVQVEPGAPLLSAIMESDPYVISAAAKVGEAMRAFVDLKVGGLPVVDERGRGVGFISDGDVMRCLADKYAAVSSAYALIEVANSQSFDERLRETVELPVSDVATAKLVALDEGATLREACDLLAQRKLKKVPVLRDGRVVGTVNRSDVLRYAMGAFLSSEAPERR